MDIIAVGVNPTIASLIIQYILFIIMNLFVGLAIVKNSQKKFMIIWGLSAIFGLVILIGISLMPNAVITVSNYFISLTK